MGMEQGKKMAQHPSKAGIFSKVFFPYVAKNYNGKVGTTLRINKEPYTAIS